MDPAAPQDSVSRILSGWAAARPDLEVAPVGITTRLARVRAHIDAALRPVFERFGLSAADFAVIVTLRRAGYPDGMRQAELASELDLTPGTISVRLDRLAGAGLVSRTVDDRDARAHVVSLTPAGAELFERIAPVHLANEAALLAPLTPTQRHQLADLLATLLAAYEAGAPAATPGDQVAL